ncbi:C4-dicarboxylate ABC transporter [Comamonas testosteroni]|uniref:C4-dicarboxylate ABC transporter n=2 Tax=Comamonas TaxID=283 RepID=A0A096HMS5_COMTE|nr:MULTISPECIES: TRAP transporter large permease subunit [Comamonas]KGH30237.1 C4-dicarboxylate ABC transporter [Comamonas testosteroni]KOC19197.1 C4-dicarboxylate ABC transporter [Comamonas testosteroni]KWT72834.1 TRAP dicarboxylate transporter, DctM subunit, unknown substrate 6 [Comamonas testosteroni]MDN5502960.1 TRAP transporter large permease subunit [Comamonas sp.]MDN5537076.1 TRAP transporter large permease subunit [Comamonas sp.]
MEFIATNYAPIMFAGLICFLLLGFPVAFSLGAAGLAFGFLGIELGVFPSSVMAWLPQRLIGIMANDTLLAVPFFTLMGLILERSGMAEDLLDTVGQVFGPIRGGLALAVIFVGALLAATTGVVAASVISMGLISLPIMLRYGYDRRLASGVIAASGTLAQIIPPSLVLILMADQLGKSVGDMYKGAFIPGFMLMGLYVVWVAFLAIFKPHTVPALPPEARIYRESNGNSGYTSLAVVMGISTIVAIFLANHMADLHTWWQGKEITEVATDEKIVTAMCGGTFIAFVIASLNRVLKLGLLSKLAERVTFVLIPPLLLIFLVLGTIFLGIATPTEGGAMGAMAALIMGFARRRLNMDLLKQALASTTKLASFVMFIMIGATTFSLVFQAADGPKWVEHLLTSLPGGQVGFLIVVNIMIFFLAFFLDYFELSFIVVPLLGPVAEKMGIDLIWFGVLLAVNMQTSFMHPPFGFALFFLRSVAPDKQYVDKVTHKVIDPVTTMQIYKGAVPFVLIQLVMVGVLIAFPGIVTGALDKPVVVDMNKVGDEMLNQLNDAGGGYGADNPFGAPEGGEEGSAAPEAPADGSQPAPAAPDAGGYGSDDPAKALQDSLNAAPAAK